MVRILTAIAMGILVVSAVWWLPVSYFKLLVLAAAALGLHEFSRMFFPDRIEASFATAAGVVMSASILFRFGGRGSDMLMLAGLLFALSLVFMWRAKELSGAVQRLALACFGMVYIGVAFSFWGLLRETGFGRELVLLALAPACLCDTFAYLAGKTIGRRKFAPMVSPNKTMEGFAGALVGSFAGVFAVKWTLLPWLPDYAALAFAAAVWIASPFGDLVESMLKRSAGVKDSGAIIPGHGGVLDRLDALIFTGPVAYFFAIYLFAA